jgi:pimeloyl-ACP methyl ester carboxylesterase
MRPAISRRGKCLASWSTFDGAPCPIPTRDRAAFCRVLLFDKAGVGLSDPVPKVRTLDDRAAEIEAVMDTVGFGQAVVSGLSDGGAASMMFAATRPERTRALILIDAIPYCFAGWDDMDRDPAELRARLVPELGEDYTPSTEHLARWQEVARAVQSGWGSGAAASIASPSIRSMRRLGMAERMSASPGMARASFEAGFLINVRPILPTITAPTLVIHAREDPTVAVQYGRAHPGRAVA